MKIFISALLVHVCAISFAQTWTNFNTSNSGLISNSVTGITVDKIAQVWVTFGFNWPPKGMQKFDGTNWTTFNISNCPLPSNDVLCLTTDENNNIWIGTRDGGLIKYDGVNWTVYDTSNSILFSNYVQGLYVDHNNFLWIDHGLNGAISVFDGNQFKIYSQQNLAIPNYCLSDIYFEDTTYAWMSFACNCGIARFNLSDSTWYYLTSSNSAMQSNYISSIDKDKNGNLWIGYSLGFYGVSKYDGSSITNFTPFTSQAWVYDLATDTSGNVYVGTRSKGLYKYDGSNWSLVPSPLPDSGTTTLVKCDRYNRIWWGEQFTGLWVSDIGNGVNEIKNGEIAFSISPNPTTSYFTLSLSTPLKQTASIIITDALGKQLKKEFLLKQTDRKELDITVLAGGVYFVTLQSESGRVTKKLVKQ